MRIPRCPLRKKTGLIKCSTYLEARRYQLYYAINLSYLDEPALYALEMVNTVSKYFSNKELLRRCLGMYTRQSIPCTKSFTLPNACMLFKITDNNDEFPFSFSKEEMETNTITISGESITMTRFLVYFNLSQQWEVVFNFSLSQPCVIHVVTFPQMKAVDLWYRPVVATNFLHLLRNERRSLDVLTIGTLSWLCSDEKYLNRVNRVNAFLAHHKLRVSFETKESFWHKSQDQHFLDWYRVHVLII